MAFGDVLLPVCRLELSGSSVPFNIWVSAKFPLSVWTSDKSKVICAQCTMFSRFVRNGRSSLKAAATPTIKLLPYKCNMLHKFDGNVTFDIMTHQFSRRSICANGLFSGLRSLKCEVISEPPFALVADVTPCVVKCCYNRI